METCNLKEAAEILHCHPDTVRKLARSRQLVGRKVGRAWVFIRDELVNFIRLGYPEAVCNGGDMMKGNQSWHYTKEETRGGYRSQMHVESELDNLLALKTVRKHRSSLTN